MSSEEYGRLPQLLNLNALGLALSCGGSARRHRVIRDQSSAAIDRTRGKLGDW
jgi:hypothetical protein